MRVLRPDQVRRIALAAQGFDRPRPAGRIDIRHLRGVVRRVDLLQIDAVQTVERAQYLPVFSRLGPYPRDLLDDAAYRRRELFEAWAHEASLVRIERWPALGHRHGHWASRRAARLEAERPGYIAKVHDEIAARGPLTVGELSDPGERTGPWWGWSPGKAAVEALFAWGEVAIADRHGQTRSYDLAERVIPAAVRARPALDRDAAHRELLLAAANAMGVATADDLADYYRIGTTASRAALDDLVRTGELEPVEVTGWGRAAYLAAGARLPRHVRAAALLTPFDPLIWYRDRAERVYDFHYRLEFYVPAEQRRYGYFVMPFVLGDTVVARADVKADRRAGVVRVPAAFPEPAVDPSRIAGPLLDELRALTAWLDLDGIVADGDGALDHALRRAAGGVSVAVGGS
jgi:uncharacterized protein YcaQ